MYWGMLEISKVSVGSAAKINEFILLSNRAESGFHCYDLCGNMILDTNLIVPSQMCIITDVLGNFSCVFFY
jgi:hypothetical protein